MVPQASGNGSIRPSLDEAAWGDRFVDSSERIGLWQVRLKSDELPRPCRGQAIGSIGWLRAVALIAGFLLILGACSSTGSKPDESRSVKVELVPAADPGRSPFTVDVTRLDESARQMAAKVRDRLALPLADGDTDGDGLRISAVPASTDRGPIYGSRADAVCDGEKLAEALNQDDGARQAWANLMDVEISEIEATLDSLHPLVLVHDTAVTNSRYVDGRGETFQAILQAGTAVLVDETGTPAVRCSCGNPLDKPAVNETADLIGDAWSDFEPRRVITIDPLGNDETTLHTVDVETGEDVSVDVGIIELDGYLDSTPDGVFVVSETGDRSMVLDQPVAQVFDDGQGGIVYQLVRSNGDGFLRDLHDEPPTDQDQAVLWHLRAGQSEPDIFREPESNAEGWLSLESAGTDSQDRPMIVYSELEGRNCGEEHEEIHCFEPGTVRVWAETVGEDRVEVFQGNAPSYFEVFAGEGVVAMATSADLIDLVELKVLGSEADPTSLSDCDLGCISKFNSILGGDRWLSITNPSKREVKVCDLFGTSSDCEPLDVELPGGFPDDFVEQVTSSNGRAVITTRNHQSKSRRAFLLEMADISAATITELELKGLGSILTAPLLRPVDSVQTVDDPTVVEETTTTTEPPAPSIRSIDFHNREYPFACQTSDASAMQVVNGSWESSEEAFSELDDLSVTFGDVDGDGVEDAVVVIRCRASAGVWWKSIVLTPSPDDAEQLGDVIDDFTFLDGNDLFMEVDDYAEGYAPMPSGVMRSKLHLDGQTWVPGPATHHELSESPKHN